MKIWTDEEVIKWCKDQHYANDYSGLWILGLAVACMAASHVIKLYPSLIQDEYREKALLVLSYAPFLLTAAFILLTVW